MFFFFKNPRNSFEDSFPAPCATILAQNKRFKSRDGNANANTLTMAYRQQYNQLAREIFETYGCDGTTGNNFVIGTDCTILGFLAYYHATDGLSRQALDAKQFRQLYSKPKEMKKDSCATAISLLSRNDMGLINEQFEKDVKETCTENFLHTRVENSQEEYLRMLAGHINEWFRNKTDNLIDDLVSVEDLDLYHRGPTTMTARTIFNGKWKFPFSEILTTPEDFFLPKDSTRKVHMMSDYSRHTVLISHLDDAIAVKIPYSDTDGGWFIAIMPQKPAEKEDLISLVQKADLENLWDSFVPKVCYSLNMPKFSTTTDLVLDDGTGEQISRIEALEDFAVGVDLSNMFHRKKTGNMAYRLHTTITNDEEGSRVEATFRGDDHDGGPAKNSIRVHLDKPFAYIITDAENYIRSMGIFSGGEDE